MNKRSVYDCSLVHLPRIHNRAGNITALENGVHLPFDVKRVYFLYDVPGGESRGGHCHKKLEQLVVALSGAFEILLDDGINNKVIRLDRPFYGLHIHPGIWRQLINFSSGSVCLALASDPYDEEDYIRDYNEFITFRNETNAASAV